MMKWRKTEDLTREQVRAVATAYGEKATRADRHAHPSGHYYLGQSMRFLHALRAGPRDTIPWRPLDRRERNEVRVILGRLR